MYNLYKSYLKRVCRSVRQFDKEVGNRRSVHPDRFLVRQLVRQVWEASEESVDEGNVEEAKHRLLQLTHGSCSLLSDLEWMDKPVTYFPETTSLLEVLDRANMKSASFSSLKQSALSESIAFVWPKDFRVDGMELSPCLARVVSKQSRIEITKEALQEYLENPSEYLDDYMAGLEENGHDLIVFVFDDDHSEGRGHTVSVNLIDVMDDILQNGKDIEAHEGTFLDERECSENQEATIRMVLRILVYLDVFPERLIKGHPAEVLGARGKLKRHIMTIGAPEELKEPQGGTHASPKTHWRNWHFRRYPRQPDGSRKLGHVFVRSTMVNRAKTKEDYVVLEGEPK